jgi:hypothetical protein
MLTKPARILCIGKDFGLLRSRVAVLTNAGYDSQAAMFHEAEGILRMHDFDLIIISATLSDEERDYVAKLVGSGASILAQRNFTLSSDLLAAVGRRLTQLRRLQYSA